MSAPLADLVRAKVDAHRAERGPLLPVLHDVHAALGSIPGEAIALIARELNLSRADVHGVVTFYSDFRDRSTARRHVRICRAEACQARGADALADHARDILGVEFGGISEEGAIALDEVFCFGNCALGPSVEVDGALYGRVDAHEFDQLVTGGIGD